MLSIQQRRKPIIPILGDIHVISNSLEALIIHSTSYISYHILQTPSRWQPSLS